MNIFNTLINIMAYSGILFLSVLLIKTVFKKQISPFLHFALWFIVIAKLCVPLTIESPYKFIVIPETHSEIKLESEQLNESNSDTNTLERIPSKLDKNYGDQKNGSENVVTELQKAMEESIASPYLAKNEGQRFSFIINIYSLKWENVLLGVWLLGSAILLIKKLHSLRILRKNIKEYKVKTNAKLELLLKNCKNELDINKNISICVIPHIHSPALTINLKPVILFPRQMLNELSQDQIIFALKHELIHYKRKDYLLIILLHCLEVVYWFNPIVWLTTKYLKEDMEILCDSTVVQSMGKHTKKIYALTLVQMLTKNKPSSLVLGMALHDTKKITERRIRGMYMKNKSSKRVRMIAGILVAVLFVTCFTTACQPTPEQDIVIGKGDGVLEEKLSETASKQGKEYNIPETYEMAFNEYNDKLKVEVAAAVEFLEASAYPVPAFKRELFTQEQVDTIVSVLMKDANMYEQFGAYTQSELEEQLVRLKKEYEDKKSGKKDSNSEGGSTLEEYEAMIAELEMQIASAPATAEKKSITSQSYSDNNHLLIAEADIGREDTAYLKIADGKLDFRIGVGYYEGADRTFVDQLNTSLSKEEAIEQAKKIVAELNVDYMQPSAVVRAVKAGNEFDMQNEMDDAYVVIFTRTYNNIPTTFEGSDGSLDDYDEAIQYEQLKVFVNDKGVVGLSWQGNGRISGNISDNVELMPFEDVMNRFKQQISVQEAYLENDSEDNFTKAKSIKITRIVFGYMQVKQKGNSDETMLIPTWNFFGQSVSELDEDKAREHWLSIGVSEDQVESDLKMLREEGQKKLETNALSYQSILTLNAVDGSIINELQSGQ